MLFRSNKGVAIIESAALLVILLSMFISGVCFVDLISKTYTLEDIVDRYLYDDAIKPLSFDVGGASLKVTVNKAKIKDYITSTLDHIQKEIVDEIELPQQSVGNYYIQSAYAVVRVDTSSGAALGIVQTPFSYSEALGSYRPPAELLEESDLGKIFEAEAEKTLSPESDQFLYAVPSGLYGSEESNLDYVEYVVLIGTRAFVDIEDSFAGKTVKNLGQDPILQYWKAVVLRGEF